MAALLLTLLFWAIVSMVSQAEQSVLVFQVMEEHEVEFSVQTQPPAGRGEAGSPAAAQRKPSGNRGLETARRILGAVNTVLPKTRETITLLQRWLIRLANLPPPADNPQQRAMQAAQRDLQEVLDRRSPFWILGTSLGFELVVLVWAAWVFCRRDY